jgi:hypothetical protein
LIRVHAVGIIKYWLSEEDNISLTSEECTHMPFIMKKMLTSALFYFIEQLNGIVITQSL